MQSIPQEVKEFLLQSVALVVDALPFYKLKPHERILLGLTFAVLLISHPLYVLGFLVCAFVGVLVPLAVLADTTHTTRPRVFQLRYPSSSELALHSQGRSSQLGENQSTASPSTLPDGPNIRLHLTQLSSNPSINSIYEPPKLVNPCSLSSEPNLSQNDSVPWAEATLSPALNASIEEFAWMIEDRVIHTWYDQL